MAKRGHNKHRKFLQSEIEAAQSISKSAMEAATILGLAYPTYVKWAKIYGIHRVAAEFTSVCANGVPRWKNPWKSKKPLDKILRNEILDIQPAHLKEKLIRAGLRERKCENCGFCEGRATDGVVPLILDFLDSNRKNFSIENLRLLCYNCTHNVGKGNIWQQKKRTRNRLPKPT